MSRDRLYDVTLIRPKAPGNVRITYDLQVYATSAAQAVEKATGAAIECERAMAFTPNSVTEVSVAINDDG